MVIITPSSWTTTITYNKNNTIKFCFILQWVGEGGTVLDLLGFIRKIGIPLRGLRPLTDSFIHSPNPSLFMMVAHLPNALCLKRAYIFQNSLFKGFILFNILIIKFLPCRFR